MAPVEPRLQEERLSPFVRVTLRIWVKTAQSVLAIIWPFFDVIMRIELAQTMVRTGVSMMLSPSVPHMAIATIALVAPILLIVGFGTSLCALALIGLILAGWRGPLLDDTNLILLALLCRYVVAGAGAISIPGGYWGRSGMFAPC